MLDYLINLSEGKIDYLPRLPNNVLLRMILMLDLEDIQRLRLVSKFFKKVSISVNPPKKEQNMVHKIKPPNNPHIILVNYGDKYVDQNYPTDSIIYPPPRKKKIK